MDASSFTNIEDKLQEHLQRLESDFAIEDTTEKAVEALRALEIPSALNEAESALEVVTKERDGHSQCRAALANDFEKRRLDLARSRWNPIYKEFQMDRRVAHELFDVYTCAYFKQKCTLVSKNECYRSND